MESIEIFREILIKELVTEESKKNKIDQCNAEVAAIDQELREFQERKNKALTEASLKGADKAQLESFRQHFDAESQHYHTSRDELLMRIDGIYNQEVGSEVVIGSVEGPYNLRIGRKLSDATASVILLKEGVVIDIR
ncbi:YlqD family protein [Desulfitobacterium sp.]|uniref:YlqD family protein n=1 Tax=Desulfitobacterium sp. TaxID=49981 RepID=UPI002B1ECF56|nr:YlqD family protein [Desulfitobacterium sp.]MEA4901605.1 YlqD family protein [Desulfitobacterium sp.]